MWLKFMASGLTLIGAGLIGLIYGAVTEQVLEARIGALLTDRKIPRHGHIIVCGLGQIGTRVVTELRRMGIPVVAIEQNADNPYIETVKRLDVPVIVASASGPGVLDRARVQKARCLVGATDDDLVNLDVALAARERRDDLRIVLRTFDRGLARPMRTMFGVDVTYSVWSLAAPAFAAAAIVGKTFGSFPWKDRAILVHEIHVQSDSPLIGQRLEEICEQYDLRGFFRSRTTETDRGEIRFEDRIVVLGVSDAMRRLAERWFVEGD
jgi:Trk K+ transport system NAD-binding subunit